MEYWIEENAPLGSRFRYRTDRKTYRVKNYHRSVWGLCAVILEPETGGPRLKIIHCSHLSEFYTRLLPYDDV